MNVPIPVVKQIENSELELNSYMEEGSQLVINVSLANDNRENNRRETDQLERDNRLRAVELESEIANAKFLEISDQWPLILKQNDALEIHRHSELQKKRGIDLIEQKNQMIEVLKRDLAESDLRFLREQAAQSEDVRILQERIENQVKFIRKQYKNHIKYIKLIMDQQRESRTHKAYEGWKTLYNETIITESNSISNRLAKIEKKENNIIKQYEMNEEIIRNLKSNINTELHNIQREFELIKMKCIENVEKLNYNYQVLKRREEENSCAKAAQRRRINKLQDILSTKRKILRETKTEFKAKIPLLRDEIEKLKQDIERHEKKTERFAEIQEKTFRELWDFSQKQITNNLEKIFKIDQIIHETQLGVEWIYPQKHQFSDISSLPSYRRKQQTPNTEIFRVQNDQNTSVLDSYTETRERTLLQLIFDMTLKNASFILDDELIEILKSHPKTDLTLLYNAMAAYGLNSIDSWKFLVSLTQSLVTCAVCHGPILWHTNDLTRLENIDSKWKTESENQLVDNMLKFAKNHATYIEKTLSATSDTLEMPHSKICTTLFKQKPTQLDTNIILETHDYHSFERPNTDSDNSTITFSLSLTDFEQLYSENDSNPAVRSQYSFSQVELEQFQIEYEESNDLIEATKFSQNINEKKDSVVQTRLCDNPGHPLTMKNTDYLYVIKKTIDKTKSKTLDQRGKNNSNLYLTTTLHINDISDYWNQFLCAFSEDRLKLWDVFDKAIKKYYLTLHLRSKKIKEVEKLETENMELKTFLKQFMNAEQDDVRLQNIYTPKIRKQPNSLKTNSKPSFTDESTNIRGTTINILTSNKLNKKKISRPFTAPTK